MNSVLSPAKEKFSVLLVDDDPTAIRVLSRILGDYAPLRFATSGSVALKLARESVPDLVLLDVEMPEFSGFDTCKAFKNDPALAAVPIIFISSHDSQQLETAGMQLGAADFISKPPHASLVLARVRTYQQLKTLSDTVRSAVTMDFLTGTMTRRQMEKTLTQEWLRAQRSHAPLSLLVVDIEGFTQLNADLGEDKGDACLQAVAEALRAVTQRSSAVLARHGGGQFSVLLPQTSGPGAASLAERALRAVDELQIAYPGSATGCVTVSLGGVVHESPACHEQPAASHIPGDLIAAAEHAARRAQAAGGHRAEISELSGFSAPGSCGLRA
jgi:diguanylate cyclase (GGDEF)-like protein